MQRLEEANFDFFLSGEKFYLLKFKNETVIQQRYLFTDGSKSQRRDDHLGAW